MEFVADTEIFPNVIVLGLIEVESGERHRLELRQAATGDELDWIHDRIGSHRSYWFNWAFDGPVIGAVLAGKTPAEVHKLVDALINSDKKTWEVCDEFKVRAPRFDAIDLMHYRDGTGGLKKIGARMGRPVADFMFDPTQPLPDDQLGALDHYLFDGDLETTRALLERLREQIEVRRVLQEATGIDGLMHKAPAAVAQTVVIGLYGTATGAEPSVLKAAAARNQMANFTYRVPEWVWPVVQGTVAEGLARTMDRLTIEPQFGGALRCEGWPRLAYIGSLAVVPGFGGAHSCDPAQDLGDSWMIDVTSLYPNLLIKRGGAPSQLDDTEFRAVYKGQILDPRVAAKKAGNKAAADGLKLVANSFFGQTGQFYSPVYDPKSFLRTVSSGQLVLIALADRLYRAGLCVVSLNTDGIVFRGDDAVARPIVADWELTACLSMEWTRIVAGRAESINSYVAIDSDGWVKGKGAMAPDPGIGRDHNRLIVNRAMVEFLRHGTPLRQTIEACRDPLLFSEMLSTDGGDLELNGEPAGRLLRVYRSTDARDVIRSIQRKTGAIKRQREGFNVLRDTAWPEDLDIEFYVQDALALERRTRQRYSYRMNALRDALQAQGLTVMGIGGSALRTTAPGEQSLVSSRSADAAALVDRDAGADEGLGVRLGGKGAMVAIEFGSVSCPVVLNYRVGDELRSIVRAADLPPGTTAKSMAKRRAYFRNTGIETISMRDGTVEMMAGASPAAPTVPDLESEISEAPIVEPASVSNADFIRTMFGAAWEGAHVCAQRYPVDDPEHADEIRRAWFGGLYRDKRDVIDDPRRNGLNRYVSVGQFYPDEDGTARRRISNFRSQPVLMVDDLGTKGRMLEDFDPRLAERCAALVETSPGNFQAWFRLEPPIVDPRVSDALTEAFITSGLMSSATDPGMKGCNRYGRLPVAANNKLRYGEPFACRLAQWAPERTVSPEELARLVGLDDLEGEAQRRREISGDTSVGVMDEELGAHHPVIEAIRALGHLKREGQNGRGWWQITCPWVETHTGAVDDGAALTIRADGGWGFCCFHSHPERAADVYAWLIAQGWDVTPPRVSGDSFAGLTINDDGGAAADPPGGAGDGVDSTFTDAGVVVGMIRSSKVGTFAAALRAYDRGTLEDAKVIPNVEWTVEGLIPARKAGVFVAEGNVGKTTTLAHLGGHMAAALPSWAGFPLRTSGSFWLFSGDDSPEDLRALKAHLLASITGEQDRADRERVEQEIHTGLNLLNVSGIKAKFALVEHGAARSAQVEREIVQIFKHEMDYLGDRFEPPAMLVWDTLRAYAGGTTNDDLIVGIATETIKLIGDELGITCGVTHHLSKSGAKGGLGIDAASGSKALTDNLRWVWHGRAFLNRDNGIEQGLVILEDEPIDFGPNDAVIRVEPSRGSILHPQGDPFFLHRSGFGFRRIEARLRRKEDNTADRDSEQRNVLLRAVADLGDRATRTEIAEEIGFGRNKACMLLDEAIGQGLVLRQGRGRYVRYRLTEAGSRRVEEE